LVHNALEALQHFITFSHLPVKLWGYGRMLHAAGYLGYGGEHALIQPLVFTHRAQEFSLRSAGRRRYTMFPTPERINGLLCTTWCK
jgi:hypothetical protein